MSLHRRTELVDEEIEENDLAEEKSDFLYSEEDCEDDTDDEDEPYEREYCD